MISHQMDNKIDHCINWKSRNVLQTGFSDFEKKSFRENGFLQYFSVSLSKNDYLIQIPEDLIYWKVE